MSESLLAAPVAIDYPSTDGKPMADSDTQRAAIIYAIDALRTWYADRDDVYVSGDLLIYYREGDVEARIAPDAFVVFGVRDHERTSYRLWEEPKAPDWVLEVASRSTWREDVGRKRQVYERLGVAEYWQYDPTGEYLAQRLLGWRLTEGGYAAQPVARWADGTLVLASAILGLEMRARPGGEMRFHDPVTGRRLLSHGEEHARAEREAARAEREAWGRRESDARAEREATRAEREGAARRAAEARVAELEVLIRQRRN